MISNFERRHFIASPFLLYLLAQDYSEFISFGTIYTRSDTNEYEHLTILFVIENNEKEQKIAFDYVVIWKTGKQFQTLMCFLPFEGFMCYDYERIP